MTDSRGFSLLELLIVVAIILIIATIAIPNILRAHQAADEAAAVSTLKTINTVQVTYSSSGGKFGTLAQLVSEGLLDSRFVAGAVSGYAFAVTASGLDYTATATPASANSGRFAYFTLPDGVVRYSTATSGCGGPGGNCFPSGVSGQPVQ